MHQGVNPGLNSGGGRGREVRPVHLKPRWPPLWVGCLYDCTEKREDCEKSKVINGLRIVILMSGNPSIS